MNHAAKGNGRINFLSETSGGQFASAFLHNGDSIISGIQTIIKANKKLDVAWMAVDSGLFYGYVSDFAIVKLCAGMSMQLLQGPVTAVSFDSLHHLNTVTFSGKGNFILANDDLTWVWSGLTGEDWHNPANWNLLNHESLHGIPAATNNVIIPAGVQHMPVVSSANPATCHDLTIRQDASLTIAALKFLTITGTLTMEDGQPAKIR
jgi:hypothetical protein